MTLEPSDRPPDNRLNAPLGRVLSLHRHPVKSLVGEQLDRVPVDERGVRGDRLWSVRDLDGKFGSGKSTRRFRKMDGLLELAAHYDAEVPVVRFPDGSSVRGDDEGILRALSEHVGRPVTLGREDGVSHFDEGPIHLVTTSTLRLLEREHGHPVQSRRLRPNIVLETADDGFVEERWVGRRIRLGNDLVLAIREPMPRCVMLDLPQVGLPAGNGLLKTVADLNDFNAGVVADVLTPGEVTIGDLAHREPG